MSDHYAQAFSFARETSKQIITLATGLVAMTVGLLGQLTTIADGDALRFLHIAWVCAGISVLFGVGTLLALTGHLGQETKPTANAIYSKNVQVTASLQVAAFLGALGFTIAFGIGIGST